MANAALDQPPDEQSQRSLILRENTLFVAGGAVSRHDPAVGYIDCLDIRDSAQTWMDYRTLRGPFEAGLKPRPIFLPQ